MRMYHYRFESECVFATDNRYMVCICLLKITSMDAVACSQTILLSKTCPASAYKPHVTSSHQFISINLPFAHWKA